jgi:hypothetical protein
VIASLGDRFVLIRLDSTKSRQAAGRRAIANTGNEDEMRRHLARAVTDVMAGVGTHVPSLTATESDQLLMAADLVTLCRTGVDYDYKGDVVDAHAPEMPTRFTKQLVQLVRGACAIGLSRQHALRLALRCARDSMPPLRLAILEDIEKHPGSRISDVRRRLNKPRNTVDRQLQALHMLNVLDCYEEERVDGPGSLWRYYVADGIDPRVLAVPDLSPPIHGNTEEEWVYAD